MNYKIFQVSLLIVVVILVCYYLFTSPSYNYRLATIRKTEKGYLVVVKGDRVLISHDPISTLLRKTYIDSNIYILPKSSGIIKSKELSKGNVNSLLGEINIVKNLMKIELYLDNAGDKQPDPVTWNGQYELIWLNN